MVNPPWVFNMFWKVIRPLLDPVTAEKVVFVANKKKDAAIVKQYIAAECLEKDFDGNSDWKYDHDQWKTDFFPQ